MKATPSPVPLSLLLRTYVAEGLPPAESLGPRAVAILGARASWLSDGFLDTAGDMAWRDAVTAFYEATVAPPLHVETLRRRARLVRHGVAHLCRSSDPLPTKAERLLAASGTYHIPGLGPAFWSAVLQALDPLRHPAWLPATVVGLRRLGFLPPRAVPTYGALLGAYAAIRPHNPGLTALHIDHFLSRVAAMPGRELADAAPAGPPDLTVLLAAVRSSVPLRDRLKERGDALEAGRNQLEAGLRVCDGPTIGAALSLADPVGARCSGLDWEALGEDLTLWVGRLWEADDPYEMLERFWRADPLPGAGLWLPTAVLHLRDPHRFAPWDESTRRGFAEVDDAADQGEAPAERYALGNEAGAWLTAQHGVHPLELAALGARLAGEATEGEPRPIAPTFGGFCTDTFAFLGELAQHNYREWMEAQRERYRAVVRRPLVELCEALAARYVEPVLRRTHGWDLETAARSGKALTSVVKNDYGRSEPYQTVQWITFYRRDRTGSAARRVGEAQFFVRLDASGVSYGLRLGRAAKDAARLFRQNVVGHAALLHAALEASGALAECRFGDADDLAAAASPTGPEDLQSWAAAELFPDARRGAAVSQLVIAKTVPPSSPLLRSDELVGDILLTFDRLLPAYLCAVEDDPRAPLRRRAGLAGPGEPYSEADFYRSTLLGPDWLRRARELLALKGQLILQGVPGTGKTHVARSLARLLTEGSDRAVRLVQFHPAYSYEEFVEGIRARSVDVGGRHDVTYPVEDGLLCAFAAEAAARPGEAHVLVIDEINRGNLPRVFGELLYLLEYREQSVGLPYSKRGFRLPSNLYLLGTMNAADRSVALVDQALRRRFSFLEMPPDAAVLAAWLRRHPPRGGESFAAEVVRLFERLNERLRADHGPACQVGHSYFMVPELDAERLRVVWEHHIRPLLAEYAAGRAGRGEYDLEELLGGRRRVPVLV